MRTFFFGLMLAAGLGCTHVQPVGPMAKIMGPPKGGAPLESGKVTPPDAVTTAAPRPTAPASLVGPADVTPDSASIAAQKLMSEIDADRKSMGNAPRTAEVSVYKGGMKQN